MNWCYIPEFHPVAKHLPEEGIERDKFEIDSEFVRGKQIG